MAHGEGCGQSVPLSGVASNRGLVSAQRPMLALRGHFRGVWALSGLWGAVADLQGPSAAILAQSTGPVRSLSWSNMTRTP